MWIPGQPSGSISTYVARGFQRVTFGANANVDSDAMTQGLVSPLWSRILTLSAETTNLQIAGGVSQAYTGATAGAVSEIIRGAVNGVPGSYATIFGTTAKFYCAARFAVSAIDAAAECVVAGRGGITGGLTWKMGAIGAASTAKFTARVNIGAPSTLTSTVNLDVNVYHTHELWSDGVNSFYSVDGEAPLTAVKVPDEFSAFAFAARNGATAANRAINLDWFTSVSDGQ